MSGPFLTSRRALPARRPHAASRRALASVPAQPRARLTSSLPPPRAPNSVRPHHRRRRPTAAAARRGRLPPPRAHTQREGEREREARKLTAVVQEGRERGRWRKTVALDFSAAYRRRRGNWSAKDLDKILESEHGIYIETICTGGYLSQPH